MSLSRSNTKTVAMMIDITKIQNGSYNQVNMAPYAAYRWAMEQLCPNEKIVGLEMGQFNRNVILALLLEELNCKTSALLGVKDTYLEELLNRRICDIIVKLECDTSDKRKVSQMTIAEIMDANFDIDDTADSIEELRLAMPITQLSNYINENAFPWPCPVWTGTVNGTSNALLMELHGDHRILEWEETNMKDGKYVSEGAVL